jgi:hypothetical protein
MEIATVVPRMMMAMTNIQARWWALMMLIMRWCEMLWNDQTRWVLSILRS